MQLRHWNWEGARFDEIEYPDVLIEPFLNWLLETHAWHEDVELVHRRVRALRQGLATHRQLLAERASVPVSVPPSVLSVESVPVDDKRARQLAQLAQARASRQAKLAAAKGG